MTFRTHIYNVSLICVIFYNLREKHTSFSSLFVVQRFYYGRNIVHVIDLSLIISATVERETRCQIIYRIILRLRSGIGVFQLCASDRTQL